MRRLRRVFAVALGVLAAILVVAVGTVYALSSRRINRTYPIPRDPPLAIPTDSAAVARGRHLATAVGSCTLCHGLDLGGTVIAEEGPLGVIAGPNLTRGRGGLGATFSDADWVRAIRYGVHRDSTSLIVMPSEVFTHFSDPDLAALIAYLKQLPPVDREVPRSRFGPMGRALLAAGKFNILVAPKTPRLSSRPVVAPGPTVEYGRYLADVSGCHGCHGYGLSGGRVAGPPGIPLASNLTPAGRIASWTEADFTRALRSGRRPDGTMIDDFMPWRIVFSHMTDEEARALWLYLRTARARPFGNK
jgi:mono/diheme cytochrome c family protein